MSILSTRTLRIAGLSSLLVALLGLPTIMQGVVAAPTCNGLTATIYVYNGLIVGGPDDGSFYTGSLDGTSGDDVIVGTFDADEIDGKEGNDTICGSTGDDEIEGGEGTDMIFGEEGSDELDGQSENDTVCGGIGDDELNGSAEDDVLDGGDGTDEIDGGNDDVGDACYQGEPNDDCESEPTGSYAICSAGSTGVTGSSSSSSTSSTSTSSSSSSSSSSSTSSSVSSSSVASSSSTGGTGGGGSGGGGSGAKAGEVFTNGGAGAYHGSRTVQLEKMAQFMAGFHGGDGVAPAAFGGSERTPFSADEVRVVCGMQLAISRTETKMVDAWMSEVIATLLDRSPSMIFDALSDGTFCEGFLAARSPRIAQELATREVPFVVDSEGFPVSSNVTWNACIKGNATLSLIRNNDDRHEDGYGEDCSHYHTGNVWFHPDLHVQFIWDRSKVSLSVPQGYYVQRDIVLTTSVNEL